MRYYDLAKRTHPDVLAQKAKAAAAAEAANVQAKVESFNTGVLATDHDAAGSDTVPFLELQEAYNTLLETDGSEADKRSTKRSGAPGRQRTLGELLCDRLKDEPEAHAELWEEIVRDELRVTEPMLDALFRAVRLSAKRDAQLDAAGAFLWNIILDGTAHGLLTIDTRCNAFVSLLTWCTEEEDQLGEFALEVIDQITDADRAHSPTVMASIGAVFCSGTRSPY